MTTPNSLLDRLDAIGGSLEKTGHALALIGLGSVGLELERLDAYSDLDFFAVVEDGFKTHYIEDLGWLSAVASLAYTFRNTPDGYKLLFADGIFCEFAVFERGELDAIPFAPGRVVWKQPWVDPAIGTPKAAGKAPPALDAAFQLGEALTNLYVGLGRYARGEKLSAARFIQQYAVDHLVELAPLLESENPTQQDPFTRERRFEQRFPGLARELPRFVQGYERSRESALALLEFFEQHFDVNPALAAEIRRLATEQEV